MSSPFTVSSQPAIEIRSRWRSDQNKIDRDCQTDPNLLNKLIPIATQHPERQEAQVQTIVSPIPFLKPPDGQQLAPVDVVALLFFLRKAEKITMKEIRHSASVNNRLRLLSARFKVTLQEEAKLEATFPSPKNLFSSHDINSVNEIETTIQSINIDDHQQLHITACCWNSTGSSIALAYAYTKHDSWCTHSGRLCIWNLYRYRIKDVDESMQPSLIIDFDGCPSAIVSHPINTSEYVLGTQTGRLYVVNTIAQHSNQLSQQEDLHVRFKSDPVHLDAITFLSFRPSKDQIKSNVTDQFVSCGLDGQIILWQLNAQGMRTISSVSVTLANLPKSIPVHRSYSSSPSLASKHSVGITCGCFSFDSKQLLVVGCEAGAMLQCFLGQTPSSSSSSSYRSNKPDETTLQLGLNYVPHRSHIRWLRFNQSEKLSFFASYAMDNEIRIYSLLDATPITILHIHLHPSGFNWIDGDSLSLVCIESTSRSQLQVLQFDPVNQVLKCHKRLTIKTTNESLSSSSSTTSSPLDRLFTDESGRKLLLTNQEDSSANFYELNLK